MTKRTFSIVVASILATGAACAQDAGSSSAFAAVDANGDGVVSEDEFVAHMASQGASSEEASRAFRAAAGDDGVLSEAEYAAAFGGQAE
ncbi:MAG: hypothetical protein ACFB00_10815 [Parvularculaceae bacterium]